MTDPDRPYQPREPEETPPPYGTSDYEPPREGTDAAAGGTEPSAEEDPFDDSGVESTVGDAAEEPAGFESYQETGSTPPTTEPMAEEPVDPATDPSLGRSAETNPSSDLPDAYEGAFPPGAEPGREPSEGSPETEVTSEMEVEAELLADPDVPAASTYGAATDEQVDPTPDAAAYEGADADTTGAEESYEGATGEDLSPDLSSAEEQASDPAEEAQFTERPLMADEGGLGSESPPGHAVRPTPEEDESSYAEDDQSAPPTRPSTGPGESAPESGMRGPAPQQGESVKVHGDALDPDRPQPGSSGSEAASSRSADEDDPLTTAFWKKLFS